MSNLDDEFLKFQAELFEAEMAAEKPEEHAPQQQEGTLPPPQQPPPALNLPPPPQQQQQQGQPLAPPPRGPPQLAAPPGGQPMQRPLPVQLPPPPGGPPMHRLPRPGQLPPPMHPSGGPPMQHGHLPPPVVPPPGGLRHGGIMAAAPIIAAPPQPNQMEFQEPAGPSGMPRPPFMPGYGGPASMPPMGGGAPPFLGVPTAPGTTKVAAVGGKKVGVVRAAAGQRWVDTTLAEWPENDYRIFVGNLGNEVSDAVLTAAFQRFPTFQKAKVVRYAHNGKSKGYGFVSFGDTIEGAKVLREMQGKYVGNRPVQLRKSSSEERTVTDKKGRARTREVTIKQPRPPKQQKVDGGPPAFGGGSGPPGGRRW